MVFEDCTAGVSLKMFCGGAAPDDAEVMLEKGFENVTDLNVSWLADAEEGFVVDPNKPVLLA